MNHILAICDTEEAYASKLAEYINQKDTFPFQARSFSEIEKVKEFSLRQEIEVLLLSEKWNEIGFHDTKVDRVFILQETPGLEGKEKGCIWKYQSCENLLKELLALLAQNPGRSVHIRRSRELHVTGFYSPVKRSLQTTFALTMGQLLAKRGRTLYVNLESYSGLERLIGKEFSHDLSDLLYYLQNGKNSIGYYLSSITEKVGNLEILPPMRCQMDLISISTKEWLQLFYEIEVCTEYEYLLLDLSDSVQGLFELLQQCDHIFTITADDGMALAKLDQYEKMLNQCQYEEILKKTCRCKFPQISYLPKQPERFPACELAQLAKEYLKEGILC